MRFTLTPRQFAWIFMVLYLAVVILVGPVGSTFGWICIAIGTIASHIFAYNFAQVLLKFKGLLPPMPDFFQ